MTIPTGILRVGRSFGCALALLFALAHCSFDTSGLSQAPEHRNAYTCNCTCDEPETHAIFSAPQQSEDDAEETLVNNIVLLTGDILDLGELAGIGEQVVGIRFPNLGIPQGSTIITAQVRFTAFAADDVATELTLYGQADPNPPPFGPEDGNLSTRPLTNQSVPWFPQAWITPGDSAFAQLTPNLNQVLEEILEFDEWEPGNAFVLLVYGTGTRRAFSFDAAPEAAPQLEVVFQSPPAQVRVQACVLPEHNPNLGNPIPDEQDLIDDCEGRVQQTLTGLNDACGYPSACHCEFAAGSTTNVGSRCNDPCDEEVVDADCTNFDPEEGNTTATNAEGDQPVCTGFSPLTAALFGRASTCEVEGQATIDSDDGLREPGASGLVDIIGDPCPGQSCAVGLSYDLELEDVTYGNFFRSATFTDLTALGGSLAGAEAIIGTDGLANFAANTTLSTAAGRRGDQLGAFEALNSDPLEVRVDWAAARTCSVDGTLVGNADPEIGHCEADAPNAGEVCTEDADCGTDPACGEDEVCTCELIEESSLVMSVALTGTLINQPPKADAGPDLVVECNQTGSARFTLHGSASDPDRNLVSFAWFRESRGSPPLARVPSVEVEQALDAQQQYIFRAIDAFGQASEDTQMTQVVDTTPPEIACNAPPVIRPPDTAVSFTATAVDACDDDVTPEVTGFDCFRINGAGRRVDMGRSCRVHLEGNQITIDDGEGVGTQITWDVRAQDASGNQSLVTCSLEVVQP